MPKLFGEAINPAIGHEVSFDRPKAEALTRHS
jgi:hypothetical protein